MTAPVDTLLAVTAALMFGLALPEPASASDDEVSATATATAGIVAELAIDRETARVNEQVLLTLTVGRPDDSFAPTGDRLVVEDATLISLAQTEEERRVGGQPYRFVITTHALFADRPGRVDIPALTFRATLPVATDGVGKGRNPRLMAATSAQRLTIDAPPDGDAAWLPALEVTLSYADDVGVRTVQAGEPFTQTIRIDARGQRAHVLPPLMTPATDGLARYPEPARLETSKSTASLDGSRTESVVMVASRAGSFSLPPVRLDWWDLATSRWREATLPGRTIVVTPAAAGDRMTAEHADRLRLALAASLVLCAALAIACVAAWRRAGTAAVRETAASRKGERAEERRAWSRVRRALRRNDRTRLRPALIHWRRRPGLAKVVDRDLATALRELDELLYRRTPGADPVLRAHGRALARARRRAFAKDRAASRRPVKAPSAPPLYPEPTRRDAPRFETS